MSHQHSSSKSNLPKSNDRVQAVLLEERTKNNGWKARHQGSGLSGHIHNSNKVPENYKPGDEVTLVVHAVGPKQMEFRWPTEEPTAKGTGKNQAQGKAFERKDGPHGKK
jgi:hypothetical protein